MKGAKIILIKGDSNTDAVFEKLIDFLRLIAIGVT